MMLGSSMNMFISKVAGGWGEEGGSPRMMDLRVFVRGAKTPVFTMVLSLPHDVLKGDDSGPGTLKVGVIKAGGWGGGSPPMMLGRMIHHVCWWETKKPNSHGTNKKSQQQQSYKEPRSYSKTSRTI